MDGSGVARILARFWFLTVAGLAVAALYLAKVLFLPLAFAVLFAFLLAPVVAVLERLRMPRPVAAILVILGFGTILAGGAWLIFTQLVAITNDLPTYRDNITQKIEALHTPSDSAIGRAQEEVESLSEEMGLANAGGTPSAATNKNARKPLGSSPERPVQVREVARPTGRLDQLSGIAEPVMTTFLSVVFTFFVILEREDLRNRLIRLSGEQNLTMMTHAMNDASARISRYFRLQLLVNLCFGGVVAIALSLIGLPHSLLFGAFAALSRFIPYFGALAAALLPTVLSLAVFQGWSHSFEILGAFLILEVFTANFAEPHIYGRNTGLTSLAIIVAAAFWTLIWGPVGLVLSMPLTVCLVVIGRHVPSLEFLTVMLGDRPVIPPPACFYQRLLARDEREAAEILETCLKGDTLENIYGKVLIPALLMSEKDREQGDLADATVGFIRQTMRELIEELGFRQSNAGKGDYKAEGSQTYPPRKVLSVPVRDETDELGALMLAQLLESEHVHAITLPVTRLEDLPRTLTAENPDLVYISGLPPFATARAHRLFRLLRAHAPKIKIMLGFWSYEADMAKAAEKFTGEEDFHIATTLADAVSEVRAYFHLEEGRAARAGEPALVAAGPSAA